MKKSILIICSLLIWQISIAQQIQISGVVTAEDDGYPLIGVSITVQGEPGKGTITDMDGNYSISVERGKRLIFSYVGYRNYEVTIQNQNAINIIMQTDAIMLEEFVAIGYGYMKKSDLTGSVASIKGDQLQKTPAAGMDQALQGRVAGVTVNSDSGQPGQAAQVRIRGIGTLNNSAPIYVVDGMIVDDITFLNPNDIESTEILKDASATAIYGSRGANGVILVSTRNGRTDGRAVVSFNTYVGFQNRWKKLDLMQSDEFVETIIRLNNVKSEMDYFEKNGFNSWLSAYRNGSSPYYPVIKSANDPNGFDYSTVETDWQDEVFNKNALIQNYHLSIEGGNDKSTYAISASYFDQEGTIIGSDYNRLTLRVNTSNKVNKWLKIGENLTFVMSEGRNAMHNSSSPGASVLSAAIAMAPWDPTHYPQGTYNANGEDLSGRIAASSNFRNVVNPYTMVERFHPKDKTERWLGNVYAEITPVKNLIFRSDVGLDLINTRHKMFKEAYEYSAYDKSDKNFLESSMSRQSSFRWENTLTYSADIKKHSFSVMIGQSTEEHNFHSLSGSGASILNPTESNWYLGQTTEERTEAGEGVWRTRMLSALGRIHYVYDNRYLATVSFRADGSNKFPENPWGYFPSVALAWRISEEAFLKDVISSMDYLKIRFGWGQIGNEKIDSGSFTPTIFNSGPTFVDYIFGPNQDRALGATVLTYVNRGGKWEVTEQLNAGIDFGFFNKFNATIDLFRRDTKEMLLPVKAPAHVGNRYDPTANAGTVRNQGVEIALDYQDYIQTSKGPLNYSISGNASFISNELTALNGGSKIYGDRVLSDKGLGLFTFWGYQYDGIYRTDEEAETAMFASPGTYAAGDAKYRDLNGDGKIDDDDRMDLGNPFPWLTYGLNIGLDYRNFDIQLFFQGVHGNKIYNALRERTEGTGTEATLSTSMRDAWTANNPNGSIPNPYKSVNSFTSSRFIENGSYFRLKNVQIGYTIPSLLTRKIGISRCRFYATISNLFTVTNYSGYDPEVGSGVDYGNYPQSRTVMLGANLTF